MTRYRRKPKPIKAYKLTRRNMRDVMGEYDGSIARCNHDGRMLGINVHGMELHFGEWAVFDNGWRRMTDQQFNESYEEAE